MEGFKLYIRQELLDHLVYPIGIKLDDESIIALFRKLHVTSGVDFGTSKKAWIKLARESGLTEIEANVLFDTYKVYDSTNIPIDFSSNSRYDNTQKANSVDVRYFGLFFALQSFLQRSKISLNIDRGDKSPSPNYASQLSSPRGKTPNTNRNQTAAMEYNFDVSFIKNNLKLFLRIIASDIHNTETSLNANEFNTLKFLFKTSYKDHEKNSLSSFCSIFNNMPSIAKVNTNIVSTFLLEVISNSPPEDNDYLTLRNLSRCVTIKTDCAGKSIKISGCDESHIFINSTVVNCKIEHCTSCTIVIAAVNKIISISKCVKCNITSISNLIRITNNTDCNIYFYSVNQPVLFGDNRGLSLGPHNVTYNDLYSIIKSSKLLMASTGVKNFSNPIFLSGRDEQVNIIRPADFNTTVVPFEVKDRFGYKLTPRPYAEEVEKKVKKYMEIQNMIRNACLTDEQEKAFHIALQGNFREWLQSTGNFKEMHDIVKMIDSPNVENEDRYFVESDN